MLDNNTCERIYRECNQIKSFGEILKLQEADISASQMANRLSSVNISGGTKVLDLPKISEKVLATVLEYLKKNTGEELARILFDNGKPVNTEDWQEIQA